MQIKPLWLPLSTAPEDIPVLLLRPGNEMVEFLVTQATKFDGHFYPDELGFNASSTDVISDAKGWRACPW